MRDIAARLLDTAVQDGQIGHRIDPADDVPAIRDEIRRLARTRHIRVRTGIIDHTILAVALVSSKVWTDTTAVMREKFTPRD